MRKDKTRHRKREENRLIKEVKAGIRFPSMGHGKRGRER